MFPYFVYCIICVNQHLFVCEAQDLISLLFQPVLSCFIFLLLLFREVISSICLYYHHRLSKEEINDVISYYVLSSALLSQSIAFCDLPENRFCLCHVTAIGLGIAF